MRIRHKTIYRLLYEKREITGHWELDTVVERKIRLLIAKLTPNRRSETFNIYCKQALCHFQNELVSTLTVDRGKEFAGYEILEKALNTEIYFADPFASWQRETNETFLRELNKCCT